MRGGCSARETALCALETQDSIGGTRRRVPTFSTAGGAEPEETESDTATNTAAAGRKLHGLLCCTE
ncbi:hypothetical protein Q8A73_013021 [Channa argus]|nr:hypothetical protein Q8A73_013021 [Channa argus]